MCENLRYESVYFKELHNQQKYYWPTIYKTGAAVVSTITSYNTIKSKERKTLKEKTKEKKDRKLHLKYNTWKLISNN